MQMVLLLCSLVTHKLAICNVALKLLQNKVLFTWNSLMQNSEFLKMHHYDGFSEIRSDMHTA